MHHDFVWVLWRVGRISFTPVVADSISKDLTASVECGSRDGATSRRVSLESMLSNPIPEVERAVGTSSAECAMLRVEGDCVD